MQLIENHIRRLLNDKQFDSFQKSLNKIEPSELDEEKRNTWLCSAAEYCGLYDIAMTHLLSLDTINYVDLFWLSIQSVEAPITAKDYYKVPDIKRGLTKLGRANLPIIFFFQFYAFLASFPYEYLDKVTL